MIGIFWYPIILLRALKICHYAFFCHCEERPNLNSQSQGLSAIPTTAAEKKHIHVTAKKGRSAVNTLRALCLALYTVIARNEAIQALNLKTLQRFPQQRRRESAFTLQLKKVAVLSIPYGHFASPCILSLRGTKQSRLSISRHFSDSHNSGGLMAREVFVLPEFLIFR